MIIGALFCGVALLSCSKDDPQPDLELVFNNYRTGISDATIALGDTIWLAGSTSSNALNAVTGDSVMAASAPRDSISVFKLAVNDTINTNAIDAFELVELVSDQGGTTPLLDCRLHKILISPVPATDFFVYRVGIVPQEAGDYMITFENSVVTNVNRNGLFAVDYQIEGFSGLILYEDCNRIDSRNLFVSEREYFFRVQ